MTEDIDRRTVMFVLLTLYSLPEKWRGVKFSLSFEDILIDRKHVSIHRAFAQLDREKMLGEFSREFSFYGRGLVDMILSIASADLLIELGGTDLGYHLDVLSENTVRVFMARYTLDPDFIKNVSIRLAELLELQEAAVAGIPHRSM